MVRIVGVRMLYCASEILPLLCTYRCIGMLSVKSKKSS